MRRITAMQRSVLQFLHNFQQRRGCMPTRAEISQEFGWASENAAHTHILALVKHRMLDTRPGTSRGLMLTEAARAELGIGAEVRATAGPRRDFIPLPVVDPGRVSSTWRNEQGRA